MAKYVVRAGDSIMGLAAQLMLPNIDPVWNHAENAELKKTREPGALVPGDILYLPEVEPPTYKLETGKRHRIVVRRPEAYLRLCLKDVHDEPIRNAPFELIVEGKTKSGSTDGDGMLEMKLPPTADELSLNVDGRTLRLRPGRLLPIGKNGEEHPAAIKGRLHNLGYAPGPLDDKPSPRAEKSLRAFQREYELEETGKPDSATVDKLKSLYGR
jgi:N-acetylmuramoyl-L-alanine amidase